MEKKRGRPRKETGSTLPKETASGKETVPALNKETVPVQRRRVGNPAFNGEAITATPSENSMYIMQSLRIASLPNIDLHDPEAVQNRINEYFAIINENGTKPTVAGLGIALNGMDRRRLWEIGTGSQSPGHKAGGDLPPRSRDIIKKTYRIMEELWENYMQNGKINPVSGIFLGKNNYGYQDKTEYVLTPNQNTNDFSEKQLLERYGIDSDSDSDS